MNKKNNSSFMLMVSGRSKWILIVAISLVLTMAATGCTVGNQPASPAAPDKVSLQLNWTHEAEFAGFYMADAKGYYKDAGIEITINEGGIPVDEYQQLVDKKADFALLTFSDLKVGLEKGGNTTAIAATFQIPPPVFFALAESGINGPQDFVGKRVAIKDEGWRAIFLDMMANAGVDPAEVEQVDVNFDQMEMLFKGEVDVWSGYVHDEITEATLAGYDVRTIFPYEYGVGNYEALLTARQETLEQNPELATRFLEASIKGWLYAVEHPDEAAETIVKWQPNNNLEFHKIAFNALIPLVDTGKDPIGWIDNNRWTLGMGAVGPDENPGYTIEFLEKIQPVKTD